MGYRYVYRHLRLTCSTRWVVNKQQGVMEKFHNGLVRWLALDIMHKYDNIPATLDNWKTAAKKEIL